MYSIAVLGTGYVGLVAGACFADTGNQVTCLDIDAKKIDHLNAGVIPIFEPGLDKLVASNVDAGRLYFSTAIEETLPNTDVIFIAVGTPPGEDGSADLQYVLNAARTIGQVITKYTVVVDKSTVPVGTAEKVNDTIQAELDARGESIQFSVVSNPEFLREGAAIEDFMVPDRVIIGASDQRAIDIMRDIYTPLLENDKPFVVMDEKSAELTKYAANSMLALRISFMNEIANLCDRVGANIDDIRRGIGTDHRIGKHFLNAGIGYGGSCFPKDVKAIIHTAEQNNYEFKILKAVEDVNYSQKSKLVNDIRDYFNGDINKKTFALWGLAFKPNTDDMREASSIVLVERLLEQGAQIQAYDPESMETAYQIFGDRILYMDDNYACLEGADGLILATEWNHFKTPDYDRIRTQLSHPVIFDGRNVFSLDHMATEGIDYISIGRPKVLKSRS